jgi:hypothetical protein
MVTRPTPRREAARSAVARRTELHGAQHGAPGPFSGTLVAVTSDDRRRKSADLDDSYKLAAEAAYQWVVQHEPRVRRSIEEHGPSAPVDDKLLRAVDQLAEAKRRAGV